MQEAHFKPLTDAIIPDPEYPYTFPLPGGSLIKAKKITMSIRTKDGYDIPGDEDIGPYLTEEGKAKFTKGPVST